MEMRWRQRELENYFCTEAVLLAYAQEGQPDDLFGRAEVHRRVHAMRQAISEVVQALETLDKPEMRPWSADIKASDEFLAPILKKYFMILELPLLHKKDYFELARYIQPDTIDSEVVEKLDAIAATAEKAQSDQKE